MSGSSRPKFFKVFLRNLSKERLRIPPAYYTHMKGRKPQAFYLSGPSGDTWQVGLVQSGDKLYFTSGWPAFVKDHWIEHGDFLLFENAGVSDLKVEIFGRNGCLKEAALSARCSEGTRGVPRTVSGGRPSGPGRCSSGESPRFTTTIHESNLRCGYMNIPLRFARLNGLLRKHSVTLIDPSGVQWLAELRLRNLPRQLNIYQGWREFSMGNKLKIGDVCAFEVLPDVEASDNFMMVVHVNELP